MPYEQFQATTYGQADLCGTGPDKNLHNINVGLMQAYAYEKFRVDD